MNILVSGGTGAGKTTTLNVLSSLLPDDERILTIEDSAELRLQQPHVVRLEYRPPNIEGRGEVTIRDLVRTARGLRPGRNVVGAGRGGGGWPNWWRTWRRQRAGAAGRPRSGLASGGHGRPARRVRGACWQRPSTHWSSVQLLPSPQPPGPPSPGGDAPG